MTDKPVQRDYEVLMLEGPSHGRDGKPIYQHLGVVNAGGADAAIAAVVKGHPYEGRYVAVPQSNWNQRDVEIEQVPQLHLRPVDGSEAGGEAPDELPLPDAEAING